MTVSLAWIVKSLLLGVLPFVTCFQILFMEQCSSRSMHALLFQYATSPTDKHIMRALTRMHTTDAFFFPFSV